MKSKMSISLILGGMFASKTTKLFERLRRARFAGKSVILYKYDKDNRYAKSDLAASHDRITVAAEAVSTFEGVQLPDVDYIGIDEGQFLPYIAEFATRAANAGKHVIISALNGQFNMKPWPNVQSLIAIAENIETLHAVCYMCKEDASFTKRLDKTNMAVEDIGGADKYVASCRKCFEI